MTTITRNLRRSTLALSTVALAAGLALGAGAISPASASADEHRDTAHIQTIAGPYYTWDLCNLAKQVKESRGYDTTPCFKDPQGWFFQYFT